MHAVELNLKEKQQSAPATPHHRPQHQPRIEPQSEATTDATPKEKKQRSFEAQNLANNQKEKQQMSPPIRNLEQKGDGKRRRGGESYRTCRQRKENDGVESRTVPGESCSSCLSEGERWSQERGERMEKTEETRRRTIG
ncbi:hypothetical protein CDL15_Pgr017038 [Punica granatum]|uniref:Uncharacterized protein n=1 Tax=Punica granatum TaxID=22663 RepID=A0A218WYI8_PUNGR|nr:hypothetical protein CDL15_Pgr017038 [Punica granatum]PKI72969.1 hypothetical protein CRG98_006669 [Punica granatum]